MKISDGEAALFAIKCFVAAMLAYWIALRIGLTRPFWAVVTSYIVAQPMAGAVLSKAVFRLLGTILGATAAVVLVPAFVNEPIVLTIALSIWLGLCLYISLLDRTPRAYVFLLAGYTASIIGIPSVQVPGTIFDTAILRVQEITIGILCGSLVHGAIFPRTVTARLFQRIDEILADARSWSRDSLAGARDEKLNMDRRRVASDVLELHQLSIHLPFDTARILPRVRTVRALQDQLSLLLPVASTVEDRLAELAMLPGGVPEPVARLVERAETWIDTQLTLEDRDETGQVLIDEARALEPAATPDMGERTGDEDDVWRDMLLLSALSRLSDLVIALRDCHDLRDQIRTHSVRAISPRVAELLAASTPRLLHLDRGLALRSAIGTFITIALSCSFWIATAWPEGGGAVLIAGIACALFGNLENPAPMMKKLQIGSTIGLIMAIVYAYGIFPRVTDFVMLAAVVAPMLLLMGSLMAVPRTAGIGLGMVIGFPQTVGFFAAYQPAFPSAVNNAVAQFIGIGFAIMTVGVFQTIGTEQSAGRLLQAGWRDVARRARGRARDNGPWMSRMLDRVGLLVPRLAARGSDPGKPMMDALLDMRVGFVTGELVGLKPAATPEEQTALTASLAAIDRHFSGLVPGRHHPPGDEMLANIDATVAAFCTDPDPARRREGLVLLTGLRRNLFPGAPAYRKAAA